MVKYLAFYDIVRLGDPVEADNAIPVSVKEIQDSLFPLIKENREYLGLIDSDETTLQMLYDADADSFWIEVPRPDLQGAFGAQLDYDAVESLLKSLPPKFPLEGFEGFAFASWTAG